MSLKPFHVKFPLVSAAAVCPDPRSVSDTTKHKTVAAIRVSSGGLRYYAGTRANTRHCDRSPAARDTVPFATT